MIAIGIDTVSCKRFARWNSYSEKKLLSLFTAQEIAYCLRIPLLSAERFAVRFAAKEAFYKAWCMFNPAEIAPLRSIIKHVEIVSKEQYAPEMLVNWKALTPHKTPQITFSLTHTKEYATAVVVLYEPSFLLT